MACSVPTLVASMVTFSRTNAVSRSGLTAWA
ncbi:Uncharacterised protein [Bordetella pertussis]|nr:Uncharacterised protein [Bordetella pertussis]